MPFVPSDAISITPSTAFTPTMQGGPAGNPGVVTISIVRVSDQAVVFGPSGANVVELVHDSGLFACTTLISPSAVGQYSVVWNDGSGDFGSQDLFVVLNPSIPNPPPDVGDETLPCNIWTSGADILAYCPAAQAASISGTTLDLFAQVASELLYRLSGRQFPGICTRTVRPCRLGCTCDWRILAWANYTAPGYGGFFGWGGGWWWGANGNSCGCGITSRVKLPGYPVRDITAVTIDGQTVNPMYYRLDNRRYLTAVKGTDGVYNAWPSCQDMNLPDAPGVGVFTVTYEWGQAPPLLGVQAALELGCLLGMALLDPGSCQLPPNTVSVQRQGVTINRSLMSAFMAGQATGLPNTDAFLAAYNPNRLGRRAAVFSPDVQRFARRQGT